MYMGPGYFTLHAVDECNLRCFSGIRMVRITKQSMHSTSRVTSEQLRQTKLHEGTVDFFDSAIGAVPLKTFPSFLHLILVSQTTIDRGVLFKGNGI